MGFIKIIVVFLLGSVLNSSVNAFNCIGKPNGNYPNPFDCASFYMCSNQLPSFFLCPKPLLFDPKKLYCNWEQNVECDTIITTIIPEPSTTPPEDFFDCSVRPTGLYPNPRNCSTFYKCSNGYSYLYDCPGDLYFHPERLICDYRHNVPSCLPHTTTQITTVEPVTTPALPVTTQSPGDPEFNCIGKPDGLYPNPVDCRSFFKCSNENAYKYDCPADLYFHPELKECRHQHEVPSCGIPTVDPKPTTDNPPSTDNPSNTPETETPNPTFAPTSSPPSFNCSDKPNGWYPNPTDCRTFFMCSNGFTYLMNCPEDLFFSPERLICDYQENVPYCGDKQTTPAEVTEDPITTTTEDPSEFNCKDKPCGDYPNPSDCTSFYKCTDGQAELRTCPETLVFNPLLQVCDFVDNVPSCQPTESPTTQAPTEAPTTQAPTEAPTTQAPTTEDPTTQAPTTEAPTTEAPITETPITEAPTTEAPITDYTTETPITEAPTTEAPITEYTTGTSITEAPTTQAPITEYTTEAPTTETQITEYTTEAPITESSTENSTENTTENTTENPTEAPITEYTTEAPTTEAPTTQAPITEYTTEAPTTETQITEYTTEDPITENTTENPTEAPTTEAPITEDTTEGSITQAPTTDVNPTETSESTTKGGSGEFTCEGLADGNYPNPEDCRTFYMCSNEIPYLQKCPEDLLFDKNLLECVHPDDAVCGTRFL